MDEIPKSVLSHIRAHFNALSTSERYVADFVTAHPEKVIHMSLMELAEASGVSDATALRFSRVIGFNGFNDLKLALVADNVKPIEAIFEEISDQDDLQVVIRKIFNANIQLLQDTLNVLDVDTIARAIQWIHSAENIYIFAVGTSAPLADMLYQRIFRLGYRVVSLTETYIATMQAAIVKQEDLAIFISRSGRPTTLCAIHELVHSRGIRTIAITSDSSSPISSNSDLQITAVSREVRSDIYASPVATASVLDVLCIGLEMLDPALSVQNQGQIWEALLHLRGSGRRPAI
jgi:RpiR family transcriptional regulator, carbohydrate utilization regulator